MSYKVLYFVVIELKICGFFSVQSLLKDLYGQITCLHQYLMSLDKSGQLILVKDDDKPG